MDGRLKSKRHGPCRKDVSKAIRTDGKQIEKVLSTPPT